MEILKNIEVPTGNILIVQGDKGKLECLSIGDYGQNANIKADFLGLSRPIEKIKHQAMMPLSEKWVITISTQYGCSMNCKFCDVPKVGKGINVTYDDLRNQIITSLQLHPEVLSTKRLNVHYARMGEPTWNNDILNFTRNMRKELIFYIGRSLIHPVISTMLPKNNKNLIHFIKEWVEIKNYDFRGDAGLQFSINSTSDEERDNMFSGNSLSLNDISDIGKSLDMPKGRKYTLNFAVADYEIDADKLRNLFDPAKFIVKLTPMHKTHSALDNGIKTQGDYTSIYPYQHIEEALKAVGFDVLVFLASEYEDLGRITCGNAILSGTMPDCEYKIVKENNQVDPLSDVHDMISFDDYIGLIYSNVDEAKLITKEEFVQETIEMYMNSSKGIPAWSYGENQVKVNVIPAILTAVSKYAKEVMKK